MLELKKITKEYQVGDFKQVALNKVSINFRKNEFASILGPSGSGKTTLLNIVGGLDHYDSGDLIINETSTKKYKDRDWDTYRNHRVGFVFQSYNLIPHQSVLANVELALTLSGISKKERRRRAKEALKEVGLEKHINKKPNMLSGGQMQRVAIARALVNDPEILLADEPTGALDSETSTQIMNILKEVAKDRLVIMVTHNPELAKEYSTRIVELKDGKIIKDSNPYDGKEDTELAYIEEMARTKKSKMNIKTALALSLNNLMTKKGRTILTAFAGSIGIIGIALILSLSNGIQNYIDKTEKETLSSYPLTIEKETIDMSSMLTSLTGDNGSKGSSKKAGKGGGISLDAKTMAKGIGSAISGAITKILSPVALVKAFFTELFPILITVGILLYAFITGWFDGDLIDVIMVLVGIIIVAYLAYLAWTMIKDMIVHGIKIACEFLKVAIEAAADWAAVYVIIAVIAVIAVAFLIAAALIIVIIGLALVGIVLAVWLITKVITSMIEDMTEKIMGIMEEQFSALEDMIVSVVSTFAVLVPMLCDLMTDVAEELEDGISDALSGIWMTFQMMTYTMETLSNEIQRIFNGLVAAILASFLGKAVKQTEEQAADITIEALNADFKIGGMLSAMIADIIGTGFTDMLSEVTESALDSLDDLIDTMADFVDDIADSAYYAMMKISDVISDMGDAAINTIYEMGIAVVVGVWQLVGTFMAILFTMPLVGLMMGLVGNNSFSEAIQPLIAQTEIIVSLLAAIVANNTMLKSQQAVPYSMTNVTEGDNYGDNSSLTTIGQTDGTHIIESPTNYTHREDAGISDEDMISNANFEKYMKAILRALAPVTQKNEKSRGFFADIF